ncbi:MAG TPA: metallophosphoesterase [Clostridia bacterium]|nr:metallophosphoesterase [Clostridia bacterium]
MHKPFSFFLITDTHYFENALGASGAAYDRFNLNEQKCLAETGAIIDSAFARLCADTQVQTVIIPGDLVFNGEKESHLGFIKKLEKLKACGKQIYVTTAGHDYNDKPRAFEGEERIPVEGTKREELLELYKDFGYSDYLAFDERTYSYVAQLAQGVRLIALNCDDNCKDFHGFDEEQMQWIKTQIDAAKAAGDVFFAVNHYPLLPGSPIMAMVGDAVIKNWEEVTCRLADWGLQLVFTGHMHMQTINAKKSEKGKVLYDVCTGSLVGCPASIRKVTFLDEKTVEIESSRVESFEWDKNGMTADEYFARRFDRMINTTIDSMVEDPEAFSRKISKAGGEPKKLGLIKFAGKTIQKLTVGKLGRLLWIKVDPSLKNVLVRDLSVEVARNMFEGDEPYVEGTPVHTLFMKALKRFRPIVKLLEKKLGKKNTALSDIPAFVASLIGNKGMPDNNATIVLD